MKNVFRRILVKSFVAWYEREDGPARRLALRRLMTTRAEVADILRAVAPSYYARDAVTASGGPCASRRSTRAGCRP